jgi:FKBP-type peptidyl-prolyl cis-trans isomerase 2
MTKATKTKTTTKKSSTKKTKTTSKAKKSTAKKSTSKKAKVEAVQVTAGDTVNIHFRGTLNDGEQFDSSYDRGQPVPVKVGVGALIKGFDDAIVGMEIGEKKSIHLTPEEAYGYRDDSATLEMPKDKFPEELLSQLNEGDIVPLSSRMNPDQSFPATTKEVRDSTIIFDMNHPMAGKELNFDIEVVSIKDGSGTDEV